MRNQTAWRVAVSGVLTGLMLVLGLIERQFPLPVPIGGGIIKLGLANSVLLYAVYMLGVRQSIVLLILKVLMSGLIYGNPSAMIYSLAGGVLSMIAMVALHGVKGMSPVGVSVGGAVFFNVGQILAAIAVLRTPQLLFSLLPVMMIAGVLTGILTGVIAQLVMRHLKMMKL